MGASTRTAEEAAAQCGCTVAQIVKSLVFQGQASGKLFLFLVSGSNQLDGAPAYYMINCAHPTHFMQALKKGERWLDRVYGVKANASAKSHAELDESETLDAGDPDDLGRRYSGLRASFPTMRILGGCCGTDHRHIAAICEACVPQAA
nr:homocysteine S-methyltransferase family protein [Mesorhizobium sp.]